MTRARMLANAERARPCLLDGLYETPGAPDAWRHFMNLLVEATGSRSARLLVLNASADRVHDSIKLNIDDGAHGAYVQHYVNTCPWRTELPDKPKPRLYSTFLDFSCKQPDFYRTEFFNDWARPQDIHHGVCGTVAVDGDETVQLLLQRTQGQGPYSRAETEWLNGLVPHLQRVIRLSRRIASIEAEARALGQAAECGGFPFLLFDAALRLRFMSGGAQQILENNPLMAIENARLRIRLTGVDARLRRLLRSAADSASHGWQHAGGVLDLPRQDQPPLRLIVMPLRPDMAALEFAGRGHHAAVFIHDPLDAVWFDRALLRELHGLTEAECRVAEAVAVGHDLNAYARTQRISSETARTQLKSAFRKTGARRQNQLAHLLLTGPACRRRQAAPLRLRDDSHSPARNDR